MTGILSRRLFVRSAGLAAAAAAPVVLASAAQAAGDDAAARLARLEAEKAVRALQQAYVKSLNAGAHAEAAKLFADPAKAKADAAVKRFTGSEAETIEFAADGAWAVLRLKGAAAVETPIAGRNTLLDMARLQGDGVLRRTEARTLELTAVKGAEGWRIAGVLWA